MNATKPLTPMQQALADVLARFRGTRGSVSR